MIKVSDLPRVRVFMAMSSISYVGSVIALVVSSFLDSTAAPFMIVLLVALFGLVPAGTLFFGWYWAIRRVYPWRIYRNRAIMLWGYSFPITILANYVMIRWAFSWEGQLAANMGIFLYITTLTFGELFGFGGAYKEFDIIGELKKLHWNHTEEQRRLSIEAWKKTGIIHALTTPDTRASFWKICKTCLSATPSEMESCWRCGSKEHLREE